MSILLILLIAMSPGSGRPWSASESHVFKPYIMREPVIAESLNIIMSEMKDEIGLIKTKLQARQDISLESFRLHKKKELLWCYYEELRNKFKRDRKILTKKGAGQKFLNRLSEVENGIAQKMGQLKTAIDEQNFNIALKLIDEALPKPPPVDSHPFYQMPEKRERIIPSQAGRDVRTGGEPTPEDTMATIDIQITSLIKDLAQELDYDPRKIYEYVKNNIDYHPYFGSMKGSVGTLYETSGNDCDQASLLIALLRTSGIPSRYQRGVIQFSTEEALKLFGVIEPRRVREMLITTGVPFTTYESSGAITGFDIEFFWVSAYLPVKHYMGIPTGETAGCSWLPMFPAYKHLNCIPGINIPQAMVFDCDDFMKQCIIDPQARSPFEIYRENITTYLDSNYSGTTYEDILLKLESVNEYFPTLPLTAPIIVKYLINEYSELPRELRHRLGIAVADNYSHYYFAVDTLPLPIYFGGKLTISWEPTSDSWSIIEMYGGLYQTPAYLIDLKPTFWSGGTQIIQGEPTGPGGYRSFCFNILTYDPNGRYAGLLFNPIDWGATTAILANQNMTNYYITNPMQDSLDIPTSVARYLHKSLLQFALSFTKDENGIASTLQQRNLHNMAFLFHQQSNDIWCMWDLALSHVWTGLRYSGSIIETPIPVSTDYGRGEFFFLAGLNADAKVKQAYEQNYSILAFSTLKGMRVAYQLGVPIYQISDYGNTITSYISGLSGGAGARSFLPKITEKEYPKPNATPKSAVPRSERDLPQKSGVEPSGSSFIEGEIIIKLTKPIRKDELIQSIPALKNAEILKQSRYTNAFLLKLPKSQPLNLLISQLQSNPLVAYAEPNYRYHIQSSPCLPISLSPYLFNLAPTDPFYENQWAIRKCLFNAVWDSTIGDSNLVLAILDSGVDTLHPDLQNRIILGYDFVNEDSFAVDDNGHGTQIAGIIGAQANNGEAIAGTDWQTKLLITKVIDAQGMATAFDIAKAIDYAVNHHARIINMSFGGYESSSLIAEAVQNAYNANCVLVVAVGNDRTSLPFYPAAYPNVIGG